MSLYDYLQAKKLLDGVSVPTATKTLLTSLVIDAATPGDTGTVRTGLTAAPLFVGLSLAPSGPPIGYTVSVPAAGGFMVVLDIGKIGGVGTVLQLAGDAASGVLVAASAHSTPPAPGKTAHDEWLEKNTPSTVKLGGPGFGLVVTGKPGGAAELSFSESPPLPAGLIALNLDPPTVLLGDTGFGIGLGPTGMIVDLSAANRTPVNAVVDAVAWPAPGDAPAWKGLSIRNVRFYLPETLPLFGKTACDAQIEIGLSPRPGIALSLLAKIGERDGVPAMTIRIECDDPTATGLGSFAPSLVEAVLELPVGKQSESVAGQTLHFNAGAPVLARARFSRDPTGDGKTHVTVALEAQGAAGIAQIKPVAPNKTAALWAIGAAGFATALIANKKMSSSDGRRGLMTDLLLLGGSVAGLLASDGALVDASELVVNRVELAASGKGAAFGDAIVMTVDYSVAVPVRPIGIGVLDIHLDPSELLRIRVRGVTLSYDPARSGLDRIRLDFSRATTDVEDAGRWIIDGPGSLFDVIGTRSGHGSVWVEVDLRFKLDLGPIKVSGATIRATFDGGAFSASLRGLDATLSMPGLIEAEGALALDSTTGFSARLNAKLVPLNTVVDASVQIGGGMVLVSLFVELPGPIPLGATGLGLYGLGGTFGIKAAIKPAQVTDAGNPVLQQLRWTPETGFAPSPSNFSFGIVAGIGTLPDLAFDFSARAGLFLTVPDVAVLGALDAHFLSGPVDRTVLPADPAPPGASVRGVVSVVPGTGASFALLGDVTVPVLLKMVVPVSGNFPSKSNDWSVYVGADGFPGEGRGGGPARMTVLPDIFPQTADAYLMMRGKGLHHWPRGRDTLSIDDGFVIAFGFGVTITFGPKPAVWAEVHGGADIIIASNPLVIAGFGVIDGSIHLGPVSLGVSAQLTVLLADGQSWVSARVCGRIRILFVKIEKCATLSFGNQAQTTIALPNALPTDQMGTGPDGKPAKIGDDAFLLDDSYRRIDRLGATENDAPLVWPDTLIKIGFAWTPDLGDWNLLGADGKRQFLVQSASGQAAQPIGSAFLAYRWTLTSLLLFDITAGAPVPGTLSAAWQTGKVGDTGEIAQPAELVLLTPETSLWLNRVADSSGMPGDPLPALAQSCRPRVSASGGWLLAGSAPQAAAVTWLPPEFVSADPTQSRVEGLMIFAVPQKDGSMLALDAVLPLLPPLAIFIKPAIANAPADIVRHFERCLALPFVHAPESPLPSVMSAPPADGVVTTATLDFAAVILLDAEIVENGILCLRCLDAFPADLVLQLGLFHVSSEKGDWVADPSSLAPGFGAQGPGPFNLIFRLPPGQAAQRIVLRWRAGVRFQLYGLTGITGAAKAAAAARQQAMDGHKDDTATVAGSKPPGNGDPNDPARRCLLQPGHSYYVEVRFTWTAQRFKQDESGKQVPDGDPTTASTTYQPLGGPPATAMRRFHFKTTPLPPAGVPLPIPAYGTSALTNHLYQAQDQFGPEMLVRHLAGYEPAQTEQNRFCDDPLRAHFDVSHVPALAGLYGYDVKLAVRRTDVPDEDGGSLQIPLQQLLAPNNPAFLTGLARKQWDLRKTTDCPIPVGGATAQAIVPLVPRAQYELFVQATRKAPLRVGTLPGVTFRTSRWRNASEMLGGLRFPVSGVGRADGDLPVPAGGPLLASGTGDAALENALAALGHEGWPVAAEPRTSLLWRLGASAWELVGVLIESPEPIERPGRTGPASLGVRLAPSHAPVAFDVRIADGSISRLLFLTSTPFVPNGWSLLDPGSIRQVPTLRPGLAITGPGTAGAALPPGGVTQIPALTNAPQLLLSLGDGPADPPPPTLVGRLTLPTTPLFAAEAF